MRCEGNEANGALSANERTELDRLLARLDAGEEPWFGAGVGAADESPIDGVTHLLDEVGDLRAMRGATVTMLEDRRARLRGQAARAAEGLEDVA